MPMKPARQSPWMTALEIALAVVLPIPGVVITLILFATERRFDAACVGVATIIGFAWQIPLFLSLTS